MIVNKEMGITVESTLPQRNTFYDPFDKFLETQFTDKLTFHKCPFFKGHFPLNPLLPAEGMIQILRFVLDTELGNKWVLSSIKLKSIVRKNMNLTIGVSAWEDKAWITVESSEKGSKPVKAAEAFFLPTLWKYTGPERS